MFKRIINPSNFLPLFLVPIIIWGLDYFVHLNIGNFNSNRAWILLLTIIMPLIGFGLICLFYKKLSNILENILPPEVTGIIGVLYSQPIYMMILKIGIDGPNSTSFTEVLKGIFILMPIVPLSNIMISTYDGTLLAVPLTCLSMVISGIICRKRRKKCPEP